MIDQGSMNNAARDYYDASYFAWQSSGGGLSAWLDRWKFEPFVRPADLVLDFGCGGGYLLAALSCRGRYGIEINPTARMEAVRVIQVYPDIAEVPDDIQFDLVISHHALEHVAAPLEVLQQLGARLRPGGKVVFVVPSEDWRREKRYRIGDINQHLYTWTPLILGNLFARAGYRVDRCELLRHRWLPKSGFFYRRLPAAVFHSL